MRLLVADDDTLHRLLLETILRQWGHDVVVVTNGQDAYDRLADPAGPSVALIDWMMPQLHGDEVCRRVRALPNERPLYLILLTSRSSQEDIVSGLTAGADDYMRKPFDRDELYARLQVGLRVVGLQERLNMQIRELTDAVQRVKMLSGLIPICSYCHKVRTDENYWQKVERYIADHSGLQFSHSICPVCYEKEVAPQLRAAGINPTS